MPQFNSILFFDKINNQMISFWNFLCFTTVLFSIVLITACNSNKNNISDFNPNAFVDTAYHCYDADKKIINFFIKEWIKAGKRRFVKEHFYADTTNLQKDTYQIDTIIYSMNKCKFFSFVITKSNFELLLDGENEYVRNFPSNYYYGGRAILGYRKDLQSKWKLSFFEEFTADMFPTYSETKRYMQNSFFCQLKDQYYPQFDVSKRRKLIPINVNVSDTTFWTSIVWDSINFRKGYFPFELNNRSEPFDNIVVNYPDSLDCRY